MPKKKGSDYAVGYKKPPRHTQFKHGQSGNTGGRPKKADGLEEVLWKALRARISILKDRKWRKVSMLEGIVMQHLTKAAAGDARAAAIVFNLLRFHPPDRGDNLSTLLQEFRMIHSKHGTHETDRPGGANKSHSNDE